MLRSFFRQCVLLLGLILPLVTSASECIDPATNIESLITPPEQRVAFVVGNSNYKLLKPLPNANNDARDIAVALTTLGFKVICGLDLDRRQFLDKLTEFKNALDQAGPDGVGLFYYAGHGAQIQSNNYILPLNLQITTPDAVDDNLINLNRVLRALKDANNQHGSRFVILDACRDNPLGDGWAKPKTNFSIKGLFWAFGTGYGMGAIEYESDRNGLFTKHILRNIYSKGDTFEELMKKVTAGVADESLDKQIPEVGGSLTKNFMFLPGTIFDKIPLWLKAVFILAILLLFVIAFFFHQHRQKTAWTRGIDLTQQLGIDKKVAEDIRRKSRLATDEIVGYVKDIAEKKLVGLVTSKYDMVIGRENNVNIVINRDTVGRQHAQLGWDKDKQAFWLEDLHSTNGTWWGKGQPLEPGKRYPLKSGQLFYLSDKNSPMVVIAHNEQQ